MSWLYKSEGFHLKDDYFSNSDNEELLLNKLNAVGQCPLPPLLEPLRSVESGESDENPDLLFHENFKISSREGQRKGRDHPDPYSSMSPRKISSKRRAESVSKDWVGTCICVTNQSCVPLHEPLDEMDAPASLQQFLEKSNADALRKTPIKRPSSQHSRAISNATPSTGILSMSSEEISNADYSRFSISLESCVSRSSQERRLHIQKSRKMRPNSSGSIASFSTKKSLDETLSVQLSEDDDLRSFMETNRFSSSGGFLLSKMLRESNRIHLKRGMLKDEKDLYCRVHKNLLETEICEDRSVYFAI
jgi:hypothetical protein